jgi:hypothetical protein
VQFAWDPEKDEKNQRNHSLAFKEAQILFTTGIDFLEIFDSEHSLEEDRFYAIGPISRGIILVVYIEKEEDTIRQISARFATKKETELFVRYTRKMQ